ncbi:MAG: hypothetical protein R3D27_04755 [Hyphomicrobiaceae bacterium]
MLVDLVPIAAPVVAALTSFEMPAIDRLGAPLLVAGLLTLALSLFFRVRRGGSLGWRVIAGAFGNWRLALLAATGIVLSLASGWTTWDGMRNFTHEPVLSLMVTFGIQGVMLIVAWLIGESFATGMSQRPTRPGEVAGSMQWLRPLASALVVVLGLVVAGLWISRATADLSDKLLYGATALLGGAVLVALLVAVLTTDVKETFVSSLRLMIKNAVLWVMFLACMATSVFFSFDSLFSTIFPKDERARAAELRAQNQVAGVANDIVALAVKRRIEEADRLFETPAWKGYERQLDQVARIATDAPALIRAEIARDLEEKRQRLAALQEKRANAESSQAALQTRKGQLTEEIGRLTTERPEPAAALAQQKAVVTEIERRLDEERAKTLAEEKGVEGSGKVGRGRFWREAREAESKTQAELEVARKRLKGHEDRLTGIDRRISSAKAELAQIDGDLAKLKGEAATASQLIGVAESASSGDKGLSFDPGAGVRALEKARQTFRSEPRQEGLLALQTQCTALQAAGFRVASLKDAASRIDCDPGQASEAAARVFALNSGIERLAKTCVGGDKLPQSGGADALFRFARSCVQDSGLPAADTETLRNQINVIELNRDDKAHRFVVTWNAFKDGNRLAYLALAIAIAIDLLVFMSGLFGATAIRSPLSDVPSHKGRSASHLEAIVENALLPDKFENAMLTLEAIHPMSGADQRRMGHGWTHEVVLPATHSAHRGRVLKVLNAGAVIGAVERDEHRADRYLVRSELFEFLATVAKKAFEADKDRARLAELKKLLVVSLAPDPGHYADVVLSHLHPITPFEDFTQEIRLAEITDYAERYIVQQALNAGSSVGYVSRLKGEQQPSSTFLTKSAFYRTLAIISADYPRTGHSRAHVQLGAPDGMRDGGPLGAGLPRSLTPSAPVTRQIASQMPPKPAAAQPPAAETPEQQSRRLERSFKDHLLHSVGIDPAIYEALKGAPWSAALAAADAFSVVRNRNVHLAKLLDVRDDRARESFDGAYDHLLHELSQQDPYAEKTLHDVGRELDQNWHVLMIMPDGPYDVLLRQAADELDRQDGEGNLSPDEQSLRRLVRMLRDVVAGSPRDSEAAWYDLAVTLDEALSQDRHALPTRKPPIS